MKTCECCGLIFEPTSSDEEAMAEAEALYAEHPEHLASVREDPAIVCDDCYRKILTAVPVSELAERAGR